MQIFFSKHMMETNEYEMSVKKKWTKWWMMDWRWNN